MSDPSAEALVSVSSGIVIYLGLVASDDRRRNSAKHLYLYFPDQIDCPARGTLWRAVNYKTAA